ncbi:hypothetical protein ACMU_09205 [Actibacterium mucosum KCTC 23349]|uniref:Amidohydrolase-related domain-containing protein n=1 Tax=Actibacterium mucosum KCTC 23349 TaxID=1454373 RepID=A0A037ZIM1_9RHOB|nr:amidohydrolase family protein [Actibacterium mucosum]KAJ55933.1 hypothetical protein ACMU_09205 [Actibacterium mucosum KCTC 23349]
MKIINCHIHTFTTAHVPLYFPFQAVAAFRKMPGLVKLLRWVTSILPWENLHDWMLRMENFHDTSRRRCQEDILREVLCHYPGDTKFVVLPMDMAEIGFGPVEEDIDEQHDELAEICRKDQFKDRVIPFASVFPPRANAASEFRRCVENHGFKGLKLYPKLGFAPDHPVLMNEIYPLCVEHNIPVVSHCSRGGVYGKGWNGARGDAVTDPHAFLPVLKAFPDLRVCLAHFGGDAEWADYMNKGFDPLNPAARRENWVAAIADLIRSGDYPNLYTDISYTIFKFNEYMPLLALFLEDPKLKERVLFGSDFYMTRQEHLSEKAVSIRLREHLGEDCFCQIAEKNPRVWLGEEA